MLSPYKYYIYAAIIAAIFAVGVGTGIHHEQPKIETLNQTIGADKTTIHDLSALTAAQNKGIADLQAAAAQRAKIAQDALDAAKKEAQDARHTAAAILSKKAPKGVNQCLAAEQEFRNELKAERGTK